jgi:hypothetical protein
MFRSLLAFACLGSVTLPAIPLLSMSACGGDLRGAYEADASTPPAAVAALPSGTCGLSGYCTSTKSLHPGDLRGLAGADALCNAEVPGSHFYRTSCDGARGFTASTVAGFVELELGDCWSCNGWTSSDSGSYRPSEIACKTGYATVGALRPGGCATTGGDDYCWRICEAVDHPLICCVP